MYKCKTITMQDNKTMVPARERVVFLKEEKIDYGIQTDHGFDQNGRLICKATLTVYTPGGPRVFTGTSSSEVSEPFCYETTETKAIGRACAAFGIGIDDSYASAEELLESLKVKPFDSDAVPVKEVTDSVSEAISAATERADKVTKSAERKVTSRNIQKVKPEAEAVPTSPEPDPEPPTADEYDPFAENVKKDPVSDLPKEEPAKSTPIKEGDVAKDPEVVPLKKPVIEKPETKPEKEEQVEGHPNKFKIEIAELSDKGTRPWSSVLALDNAITAFGITSKQIKDNLLKIHPEYEGWEEEDIMGAAASLHLHEALNLCEAGK